MSVFSAELPLRFRLTAFTALAVVVAAASPAAAQQSSTSSAPPATQTSSEQVQQPRVFDMGKIVVIGTPDGQPAVGGAVLTSERIWTFDRKSLDQAVNIVPGVVSTFDANGRRNESDIFVRGFGR